MNVLDSNVEALAFNYLNFGLLTILNNLWTCLALLTAALSFWKIRSVGYPKPESSDPIPVRPDPVEKPLAPKAVTAEIEAPLQTLTVVANGCAEDVDGVRKGKFMVYYYEEDINMQCGNGESNGVLTALDGWEWEEREGCESEWWKCWEKVLRLRNGENEKGWYTCQDLTDLNGNVVRFWDGGGCFTKESLYSSSCMPVFVSE